MLNFETFCLTVRDQRTKQVLRKSAFAPEGFNDLRPEHIKLGGSLGIVGFSTFEKRLPFFHLFTITDIDDLEEFCKKNSPEIAVLCIPKSVTKEIVDRLMGLGIRSFWNFSHYDINVEHNNIIVENVHLGDSLMTLSYGVNNNLDDKT